MPTFQRVTLPVFVQHLHAQNDVDGQPRALSLAYGADGRIIAVSGRTSWFEDHGAVELPELPISASTYRRLREVGRQIVRATA